MLEATTFLDAGLEFHGHKCPAMPMGLRSGAIAMNRLGVGRSGGKTLLALVELGDDHCARCFGDGVQVITGCTFGKGNLRQLGYGKFGLTLVDVPTGRAVRVVPRGEGQVQMKQTTFFTEFRMKGVPPTDIPDEIVDPLIEKVLTGPEDALFQVSEVFDFAPQAREEEFDSFLCSRCGEMVVEKYGRVVGDSTVCIPCREAMRNAG